MSTLIDYRKARFDYEILDTYEAGIELLGHEVKSLKRGQGSLEGSYVIIRGGEAFVMNMFVPPYQEKNTPGDYDPRRTRRLLVTRKELLGLASVDDGGGAAGRGLTIVPISVYNKGKLIKIQIAVVRGKKRYDKRTSIEKRETDRTISRALKNER